MGGVPSKYLGRFLRNIHPNIMKYYVRSNKSMPRQNKYLWLENTERQKFEECFPYAIINANYMKCGSLIDLFHWSDLWFIKSSMTQFKYFMTWTIYNWFSIVKFPLSAACTSYWYLFGCNAFWENHVGHAIKCNIGIDVVYQWPVLHLGKIHAHWFH